MKSMLKIAFWKSVWNWCKVNWKFLVGFAVPCVVLYFFNQKKAQSILKKGIEIRKKQLDVVQRAADLESAGVRRNAEEFATRVEEVTTRHEETFQKLDENSQARREKLGGSDATTVTKELADKFKLTNGDIE
jgi:hypothetical protein